MDCAMIKGVLFDLDGTLVDSAPDLGGAVNVMRLRRGLEGLPIEVLRPYVSQGAKGLLWAGFGLDERHDDYMAMRSEFLDYYEQHATERTRLFEGMSDVLDYLEGHGFLWGIVTNKHKRFTRPVVEALALVNRAQVIVCGDSTEHAKPHPAPMLYAAAQLGLPVDQLMYLGDDLRDIQAARAADYAQALAVSYGCAAISEIGAWGVDGVIHHPRELISWLEAKF